MGINKEKGFWKIGYKAAALLTGVTILLSGCGSFTGFSVSEVTTNEGDIETKSDDALISVGFSQLGSESTWRSANTESVKASLSTGNGFFLILITQDRNRRSSSKRSEALFHSELII